MIAIAKRAENTDTSVGLGQAKLMIQTASIFEELGFENRLDNWSAEPQFRTKVGRFTIDAEVRVNRFCRKNWLLSAIVNDRRTIAMIEAEVPLEVSSNEEGRALIGYFLGQKIPQEDKTDWLLQAEALRDYLPWAKPLKGS